MSVFLFRANSNEAIIVEALGRPISASLKWKFIFFPCVSVAKRFQVDKYNLSFQTEEVETKDGKRVTLHIQAKFKVDTTSGIEILKAYKKFLEDAGPDKDEIDEEVLSLRSAVRNIITKVTVRQILKMTYDEAIRFHWMLIDNIHNESSYVLKQNGIVLQNLELKKISDMFETKLVEEDVYLNVNQEELIKEDTEQIFYDPDNQSVDEEQPLIASSPLKKQEGMEEQILGSKLIDDSAENTQKQADYNETSVTNPKDEDGNTKLQERIGSFVVDDQDDDIVEIINIDAKSDDAIVTSDTTNAPRSDNPTESSTNAQKSDNPTESSTNAPTSDNPTESSENQKVEAESMKKTVNTFKLENDDDDDEFVIIES